MSQNTTTGESPTYETEIGMLGCVPVIAIIAAAIVTERAFRAKELDAIRVDDTLYHAKVCYVVF